MSVAAAYAECRGISRASGSTFYAGMRLLPADRRDAIFAIYALARRIDDIADGTLAPGDKLAALAEIRTELSRLSETADLVLQAVADAADRYPIPLDAFETNERTRAESLAEELGVALQLTNILRDLSEDMRNGRRYLPAEDLYRFGCSFTDARIEGPVELLVAFEAQRALNRLALGLTLVPLLDRRSAACVLAMAGAYRRLLERIALRPDLALRGRPRLRRWEKGLVLAQSLARSAA